MLYQVRALNAQQELVDVRIEAVDEASALSQLKLGGLTAIEVRTLAAGVLARRGAAFPLLLFAQELHALLVAGLSVIEALAVLTDKETLPATRDVVTRLTSDLSDGLRLSDALARQPAVFPPLFVGIMQSAEGTSDLPRALLRYIDHETRLNTLRQKVISSAVYPAILLAVGAGVAAFLMGYVVPRFAEVYRSGNRPLPWASQLLLDWGTFAGAHAAVLGGLFIAVLGTAAWSVHRHLRAGTWWRLLAVVPGTRPKLELLELSRLYMTLGMLLEGGLPISTALQLARSVLPETRHAALDLAGQRIAHGEALSTAFVSAGLSTPVAMRLLKVGEQSGQLGVMLTRTADFYESYITRWIERFTKAFEPLLMAAIGIAVGLIVILLYMPIFDLAGSLQ